MKKLLLFILPLLLVACLGQPAALPTATAAATLTETPLPSATNTELPPTLTPTVTLTETPLAPTATRLPLKIVRLDHRNGDLREQIRAEAAKAAELNLTPFVYFYAMW